MPSLITATVDQKRTTIVLYAECQTDHCLFIISASYIARRIYDGSHRQPCRCISLASHQITFTLHSADSHYRQKNRVTDNLCTLSITLTTKGTVTAIIFTKVQIVHFDLQPCVITPKRPQHKSPQFVEKKEHNLTY